MSRFLRVPPDSDLVPTSPPSALLPVALLALVAFLSPGTALADLASGIADVRLESDQPDPPGYLPCAFGGFVSDAGDVNGDGYDDVIVGAVGYDAGDPHEGAAFVFLGSASGIVGTDPSTAHAIIQSDQFGAQLGSVTGAGDVNGDGYDDIAVGAHAYTSPYPGDSTLTVDGAVFVFHGSPAGITGTTPATADARIVATQLGSELGIRVAAAGDVNGDGYDDLVAGAPGQGIPFPPPIPPNQGSGSHGAAFVFLGGPSGITDTDVSTAHAALSPFASGDESQSLAQFGNSVAGAGDVNGDGYDDVIVGAHWWNNNVSWPGSGDEWFQEGAAFVFLGSASGIVGREPADAHARIEANVLEAHFGSAVAGAGDVDGDGFDDVIVGSVKYPAGDPLLMREEGGAFVFRGGPSGITATSPADAHAAFVGTELAEWLGMSVSGAGDPNSDGFDDVLVGARVFPGSLAGEGVAYLFHGGPAGIDATSLAEADARLSQGQANASFGSGVSFAGDVDGDGFDDALIGASAYDAGETDEGAAFLYRGGGGAVAVPAPVRTSGLRLAASPDPFRGSVVLEYSVERAGPVRLSVHDVTGRRVAVLRDGPTSPGSGRVIWDGTDGNGTSVAAGVYFVRLATGSALAVEPVRRMR